MKIAVLAHNLHVAGGLSVGKDIITTLPEIAPMHQYLFIVSEGRGYPEFPENANIQIVERPISLLKRFLGERRALSQAIKNFDPDWLWAIGNIPLRDSSIRQSLFLQNPHYINYKPVWFWQSTRNVIVYCYAMSRYFLRTKPVTYRIRRSINHISHVYCQTKTICQRFAEFYRCDISKVHIFLTPFSPKLVPVAPDAPVDPNVISEAIQQKYASRFKLFYPSVPMPHKNMEKIVSMYQDHRDALASTLCILPINPEGSRKERRITRMIRQKGLEDYFLLAGHISPESIAQYYHFSDAIFFPSLLETLGLGHLEGMYCHRPVIASDLDFAHDVCGDAAYFVNPYSTTSMKDGILALQQNPELCKNLVEKGITLFQKSLGTWEDAIRGVLDQEQIEHL